VLLFVTMTIAGVRMGEILREIWPFLLGLLAALAIITYVPALSLWLPRLIGP